MENCHNTKKLNSSKVKFNHKFSINKIKLSGDVEENPGPTRKNFKNQTIHLEIILILATILLWISSKNHQKSVEYNQNYQNKHTIGYIKLPIFKRKSPIKQTAKYYFMILLLISNDIETNPGPTTKEINCSSCRQQTTSTNKLQCNTCSKIFHKTCVIKESTTKSESIQWICTEKNCPPNYHKIIIFRKPFLNPSKKFHK